MQKLQVPFHTSIITLTSDFFCEREAVALYEMLVVLKRGGSGGCGGGGGVLILSTIPMDLSLL